MSIEIENQCVRGRLELEEGTKEVHTPSKITYTMPFLISFTELDICKELPAGFKPSILREFDDVCNSLLEWQRIPGSASYSSRCSEYGSSPSTRCDLDNTSQKSSARWDSLSSQPKNGESHSQRSRDSDSGRCNGDLSRCSWQNPEIDGLLGTSPFRRVSGCTAGVLAPRTQENCQYQLNKSDNPYRPPHSCKVKKVEFQDNHTSGKISNVVNMASDSQEEKQSDEHIISGDQQNETNSLNASLDWNNKNVNSLAEGVSDNLIGVVRPLSRAASILEARVSPENELEDCEADKVTIGMTIGISGQGHSRLISKEPFGNAFEVESCGSSILIEQHNFDAVYTQGAILQSPKSANWFFEEKKPADGSSSSSTNCGSHTDGGYNGLFPEHNSPTFFSDRNKPYYSEIDSHTLVGNISIKGITGNSEKNHTLEPTFRVDFMNKFQSNEAVSSVQRGLVDNITRSDISELCGSPISIADDNLLTLILDECGAFGMNNEGTMGGNFAAKTDLDQIEKDNSVFENAWAEILSLLQMEQEVKCDEMVYSEVEICLPDDDNLIAFDYSTIPEDSCVPEIASVLPLEQESKLSPVPGCDKMTDLKAEICWPDEESLITINDLITPQCSKSHKTQMKVERPSFNSLGSPQSQINSQTKFMDPNTFHCTSPPCTNSCTNVYSPSWKTLPAKLQGFDHPVRYSVLQQPMNFLQQNQMLRGAVPPDHIMQVAFSAQELNPMHFIPLDFWSA